MKIIAEYYSLLIQAIRRRKKMAANTSSIHKRTHHGSYHPSHNPSKASKSRNQKAKVDSVAVKKQEEKVQCAAASVLAATPQPDKTLADVLATPFVGQRILKNFERPEILKLKLLGSKVYPVKGSSKEDQRKLSGIRNELKSAYYLKLLDEEQSPKANLPSLFYNYCRISRWEDAERIANQTGSSSRLLKLIQFHLENNNAKDAERIASSIENKHDKKTALTEVYNYYFNHEKYEEAARLIPPLSEEWSMYPQLIKKCFVNGLFNVAKKIALSIESSHYQESALQTLFNLCIEAKRYALSEELAREMPQDKQREECLSQVSLSYCQIGKYDVAKRIAKSIVDSDLRVKTLTEIDRSHKEEPCRPIYTISALALTAIGLYVLLCQNYARNNQ